MLNLIFPYIFIISKKVCLSDCIDELKVLAYGPLNAYSYNACIVNAVWFVVCIHDLQCIIQNSGFVTLGEDGTPLYGQLEEII